MQLVSKFSKGFIASALIILTACESKRVDPPPQDVQGAKQAMADAKQLTIQLNSQFSKIRTLLVDINIHYGKFIKLLALSDAFKQDNSNIQSYTPVDALIDIVDQAQKGVLTKSADDIQKDGRFELPVFKDGDACRNVDTHLAGTVDELNQAVVFNFSIQGCFNSGAAIQIAHVEMKADNIVAFSFDLNSLQSIIDSTMVDAINKNMLIRSNCQLMEASNGQLPQDLTCKNIKMKLQKETITISELNYLGTGPYVLRTVGQINGEDSKLKATFKIGLFRDANKAPEVDLQNMTTPDAAAAPIATAPTTTTTPTMAPVATTIK